MSRSILAGVLACLKGKGVLFDSQSVFSLYEAVSTLFVQEAFQKLLKLTWLIVKAL